MAKTARQLEREIAEALSGHSKQPPRTFTIHGARQGANNRKTTTTPTEAKRIAREMAKNNFSVTVLEQDPQTREYRAVLRSDRVHGRQKITPMDSRFEGGGRGAHARKKKLDPHTAKQLLEAEGIDFKADFLTLPQSKVSLIYDVAHKAGYRKRKDAPGSTAWMYFKYLSRLR